MFLKTGVKENLGNRVKMTYFAVFFMSAPFGRTFNTEFYKEQYKLNQ